MRAVLDPNVLISALLAPAGTPARLVLRWLAGEFELVVSERLLTELERALAYPKIRARVAAGDAAAFVALLRSAAELVSDPQSVPSRSADSGDDYLIALAEAENARLVSGDKHLLALSAKYPIVTPRQFLETIGPSE